MEIAATNKQTAGYHAVDGGTVGEGIEGFASASYSKSNETQFTNANLNANNININTGKDFTLKLPQITVDTYGHVTAAADENVVINIPKATKTEVGLGSVVNAGQDTTPTAGSTNYAKIQKELDAAKSVGKYPNTEFFNQGETGVSPLKEYIETPTNFATEPSVSKEVEDDLPFGD